MLYLMLWILAAEDDVRQEVGGTWEMLFLDSGIESGVFFVGEGVQVAAHALQAVQYLDGRATAGALEAHVLAEVGHPLFASLFVS